MPERQTSPVATVSTEGQGLGCRGRGGEEEEIKKGTRKLLSPLWLTVTTEERRRRWLGRGLLCLRAWEAAARRLDGVMRVDSEKEISPVSMWISKVGSLRREMEMYMRYKGQKSERVDELVGQVSCVDTVWPGLISNMHRRI